MGDDMKNKGSVLFITTALMLVISIISIFAFSMFYRDYTKTVKEYNYLLDKIEVQTLAQDIYIELTKLELVDNEVIVEVNNEFYTVTLKEGFYEYNLEETVNDNLIYMTVKIDSDHNIHVWKVWS